VSVGSGSILIKEVGTLDVLHLSFPVAHYLFCCSLKNTCPELRLCCALFKSAALCSWNDVKSSFLHWILVCSFALFHVLSFVPLVQFFHLCRLVVVHVLNAASPILFFQFFSSFVYAVLWWFMCSMSLLLFCSFTLLFCSFTLCK